MTPAGRCPEKIEVCRDDRVDQFLTDNWHQVVEEMIPSGLSELFFFDAEKIRFLADDDSYTVELERAIKSVLGLDLASQLTIDLGVVVRRMAATAEKSDERQQLEDGSARLKSLSDELEVLQLAKVKADEEKRGASQALADVQKEFEQSGGDLFARSTELEQQKTEVGETIDALKDGLVQTAAGDLPLQLVPELLGGIADQADRELEAEKWESYGRLLEVRDELLVSDLVKNGIDETSVSRVRSFLIADRQRLSQSEQVEIRLLLSSAARERLGFLVDSRLSDLSTHAGHSVTSLDDAQRVFEDLQRSLQARPDEDKAKDLFDKVRDAERQLSRCEGKVDHVTESFEEKKRNFDEVQTDLKRLSRKLIDEELKSEEDQRVAQLALRVQGMTDRFLEEATRRKVDRLSESVSGTLKELMHKSTLVDRVEIDPESFQITIFDAKKRVVPKERLSEGEKQLFAISVLWGLSRAASQQLPTIIDTPMARLDGEHRQRLLTEYFPAASHQVIILSTDTEVDKDGFQAIQPSIARAYHLNYDEESRVTRIEDGYFWSAQESHEPATEKVA